MRILLWLLPTCLALSACNMAMSNHPMFSPEEQLATPLKDGLWVADDPDCRVDTSLPRNRWPNCAFWVIVSGNQVVDIAGDKEQDRPTGFLIVGGQPPIVQIEMTEEGGHSYLFYALDLKEADAPGPLTKINLWPVACGTEKVPGSTREIDPFPGLNKDCQPQTIEALRAAAITSRPKADDRGRMKWVRLETR